MRAALVPGALDVMAEAMAEAPNAQAYGRGLMAEGGASIEVLAATWMTANRAARNAAAMSVGGMYGADEAAEGEAVTAAIFYSLGETDMPPREALAMFFAALIGEAPRERSMMAAGPSLDERERAVAERERALDGRDRAMAARRGGTDFGTAGVSLVTLGTYSPGA